MAFPFLRKRAGENSEEGTAAHQALIESVFDGVVALDRDGLIIRADPDFYALTGLEPADTEGRPLAAFADPADAEKLQHYLVDTADQAQVFGLRLIDGSGSVRMLRLHAVPFEGEDRIAVFAGVQDISEEENLRQRLAFTEKIDLLNRLMNGVVTDLQRALKALAPVVETSGDPGAASAFLRLSDLQRRVGLFPRRGIRGGAELSIPGLVEQAAASLEDEEDVVGGLIELDQEESPHPVFGDGEQLEEALRQVLHNARQAAAVTGGDVRVVTSPLEVTRARPHRGFLLPPGSYTRITVTDTGPGMPPEVLDHVFDPLFTTRGGSPLAGLGLAIAYTIVKNHRGYIGLESESGTGTTVEIFLPRSRVGTRSAPESTPEPAVESAPERAPEPAAPPAAPAAAPPAAPLAAPEAGPEEPPVAAEVDLPPEAGDTAEVEAPEVVAEAAPVRPIAPEPELAKQVEPAPRPVPEPAPGPVSRPVSRPAPRPAPEPVPEPVPAPAAGPPEAPAPASPPARPQAPEAPAPAPPAPAPPEEAVLDPAEAARLSGHETILVIEESAPERTRIAEALNGFGYNTLPARNWVEGVDLFKRHTRIIDLVLLDIMVPEMIWVKTLIEIQRVDAAIRVVMVGGPDPGATAQRYLKLPSITHIEKPLTVPVLLRGVRGPLDGAAPKA
jgi:PAS domain S-box-containing protein